MLRSLSDIRPARTMPSARPFAPLLFLLCAADLLQGVSCLRKQPEGMAATSDGLQLATAALRKRGVGWALNTTLVHTLEGLAWWYNWGPSVGNSQTAKAAAAAGMRFVPMQWGRWGIEDLPQDLQRGSSVLLGFNEPNHRLQAGLTPQEAAELWPQLEAVADQLGLRLGAPAAAPCGAQCVTPDPFQWWDEFFARCHGCRVDFLATHYYSCNVAGLAAYLQHCRKYGRPIWLTEFACPNPGGADVISWQFMARALPLLDRDGWVEKYAWYSLQTYGWLGTSNSLMDMDTGELTELGLLYLTNTPAANSSTRSAGRLGDNAGSSPRDASNLTGEGAVRSWVDLCRHCIQQIQTGSQLAALAAAQRQHCSETCGFWADAVIAGGGNMQSAKAAVA